MWCGVTRTSASHTHHRCACGTRKPHHVGADNECIFSRMRVLNNWCRSAGTEHPQSAHTYVYELKTPVIRQKTLFLENYLYLKIIPFESDINYELVTERSFEINFACIMRTRPITRSRDFSAHVVHIFIQNICEHHVRTVIACVLYPYRMHVRINNIKYAEAKRI